MQEDELYVINGAGEVQNVIKAGDRILRNGSIKYLNGVIEIKFNFVKLNSQVVKELSTEGKYVWLLLEYIEIGTGFLKYANGRVINTKGKLAKILSKDEKTGRAIVNRLIKRDVIHRNKERGIGVYFTFNPFIAHCGKKVPKILYNDFFNSEWRDYTDEL